MNRSPKKKVFVGTCLFIVVLFFALYLAGIAALMSGCATTNGPQLPKPIPVELERAK